MNWITFGKDQYHLHRDMEFWCEQHFGQGSWIGERYPKDWTGMPAWTIHSMFGNTTFAFNNTRHYTWFVLRWGSQ